MMSCPMMKFGAYAVLIFAAGCQHGNQGRVANDGRQITCDHDTIYLVHPMLKEEVRFSAVADSHFAFLDERDAAYRELAARMMQWPGKESEIDSAFASAMTNRSEFVLLIGDMISFPSLANIEFLQRKIAASGFECWYIAGNHDWCYEGYGGSREEQRNRWIGERMLVLYRGRDPEGYSFTKKGVRFVMLDNSLCSVTERQIAFVQGELAKGEPTVIVMHVPFYMNPASADDTMGHPDHNDVETSRTFRELVFSSPNVVAVLAGHEHYLQVGCERGIPQLILPEGCFFGRSLDFVLVPR